MFLFVSKCFKMFQNVSMRFIINKIKHLHSRPVQKFIPEKSFWSVLGGFFGEKVNDSRQVQKFIPFQEKVQFFKPA